MHVLTDCAVIPDRARDLAFLKEHPVWDAAAQEVPPPTATKVVICNTYLSSVSSTLFGYICVHFSC